KPTRLLAESLKPISRSSRRRQRASKPIAIHPRNVTVTPGVSGFFCWAVARLELIHVVSFSLRLRDRLESSLLSHDLGYSPSGPGSRESAEGEGDLVLQCFRAADICAERVPPSKKLSDRHTYNRIFRYGDGCE